MDIDPDLDPAIEALVIDAWLDNQEREQNIYITRSQAYFDNSTPTKVEGAIVTVLDENGVAYPFIENDSAYTWTSNNDEPFGEIGLSYVLIVEAEGQTYQSFSRMNRVPEIDSIKFNYEPDDTFFDQPFYFAEFVATDLVGIGDTYWIKAWKNGNPLNKPSEINVAFDAGFTAGGVVDGQVFIQPIQDGINPFDENPEVDNEILAPYLIGDSVYVEIHSINLDAFFFLNEVSIQTNRDGGFGALFAQPLANVSSNIFDADESSTEQVFGFFNVAAISSMGKKLTEDEAEIARNNAD
jgi:hypothetical protein